MRIYTRTGDQGQTHLFAGARVPKDHARIEACGTVDELNCVLGLARAESVDGPWDDLLSEIQSDLLNTGAQLATPDPRQAGTEFITETRVARLEEAIDRLDAVLPPLTQLILSGGTRLSSLFHLARTVCRRAERRVVTLSRTSEEPISPLLLRYLNRLSDLLFVLARSTNQEAGIPDEIWRPPRE